MASHASNQGRTLHSKVRRAYVALVHRSRVAIKGVIKIVLKRAFLAIFLHLSFQKVCLAYYNLSPAYLQVCWFKDTMVDVLWQPIRSLDFLLFMQRESTVPN